MESIEWICEYRDCNKTFKRYPSYIKQNIKRFCCQSHGSLEQKLKERESGVKRKVPTYTCSWCKLETKNYTKVCTECKRIERAIRSGNMQGSPLDYYRLLEEQENKCLICKIDRCSSGRRFCIDHDHKTGLIRGLLCLSCNTKLGWYENYINVVREYLLPDVDRLSN